MYFWHASDAPFLRNEFAFLNINIYYIYIYIYIYINANSVSFTLYLRYIFFDYDGMNMHEMFADDSCNCTLSENQCKY